MGKYNKHPKTVIKGYENSCILGYKDILKTLCANDIKVLVIDTYPGVNDEEVIMQLETLNPSLFINMKDIFKSEEVITEQLKYHLTDDRVFGKMYFGEIMDFIDEDRLQEAKTMVAQNEGFVIVYGYGASLITKGDILVYLDMARWEIQMRYRQGLGNYKCSNFDEDVLKKYKRAFFIEWRVADKHKMTIFDEVDYFIDTNRKNDPKMVSGEALREGLKQISRQPFRTVPYFDPGVWGGQWMKEVCDLDRTKDNFAWSFDGVPEENSLFLDFENGVIEIPAMDLVLYQPKSLLGEQVYARFGAEFPIRFDFLDTIEGQNLSLQVHPLTEYIKKQFGMSYTQDESYYILDTKEDAVVYLGLKDNVDPEEMIHDLRRANLGEGTFNAEKYINKFPAKKHDHFLIPAGTCHCSGTNTMILEISATPYIFTFKLWDWGRVGLDGKPRPVHIDHGKEVIQWDRTTSWVKDNLVNRIYEVKRTDAYVEEHTGLHELEFIETRRYWIEEEVTIQTKGTVNMLNLVEGTQAVIESPNNKFSPYFVNHAETFILPASVKEYVIRPVVENEKIGIIRAYVR
ncbi:mannose-6-phosphate isomerase class I [Mobilisporobacter senegalensis]|uniref:Mannose-6-phosphate isomerase class I n=1 Tax=Mobilisporobacter senegalensis TaxID=1329262 RepID=A0A3N1XB22_9FIRM|nr:class I mannose-6-phosphate isomerase [Mobilisporobacter senegalensis]ROR22162.1 mannose-6-phosphate isomerase class I [Mobilisporobacter senegalensis]